MSDNTVPCTTCHGGDFYEQAGIARQRHADEIAYAKEIGNYPTLTPAPQVLERAEAIDVTVPDAASPEVTPAEVPTPEAPAEAPSEPVETSNDDESAQTAPEAIAAVTEAPVASAETPAEAPVEKPKAKRETAAEKKKRLAAEAAAATDPPKGDTGIA